MTQGTSPGATLHPPHMEDAALVLCQPDQCVSDLLTDNGLSDPASRSVTLARDPLCITHGSLAFSGVDAALPHELPLQFRLDVALEHYINSPEHSQKRRNIERDFERLGAAAVTQSTHATQLADDANAALESMRHTAHVVLDIVSHSAIIPMPVAGTSRLGLRWARNVAARKNARVVKRWAQNSELLRQALRDHEKSVAAARRHTDMVFIALEQQGVALTSLRAATDAVTYLLEHPVVAAEPALHEIVQTRARDMLTHVTVASQSILALRVCLDTSQKLHQKSVTAVQSAVAVQNTHRKVHQTC